MQTTLSQDDLFLLGCFGFLALTVALLAYRSKRPQCSILLHAAVCAAYALPLLYALHYHSAGGAGLVWFVYLLFAFGLHWLVSIVLLAAGFRRQQ